MNEPLAERIRPKTLEDYISQQHLVGSEGALTTQIKNGVIPSLIFWGPPGTGKTTLANIIATESQRPFYTLSAISSGVKDVREVIDKAKQSGGLFTSKNPILFIDEIHRFSKSQQDSLLGAVEKGWVTLIGATTENPSFEVSLAFGEAPHRGAPIAQGALLRHTWAPRPHYFPPPRLRPSSKGR